MVSVVGVVVVVVIVMANLSVDLPIIHETITDGVSIIDIRRLYESLKTSELPLSLFVGVPALLSDV